MCIGGEKPGPWDKQWSGISSTSIKNERCKLHENTIVSYLHRLIFVNLPQKAVN